MVESSHNGPQIVSVKSINTFDNEAHEEIEIELPKYNITKSISKHTISLKINKIYYANSMKSIKKTCES